MTNERPSEYSHFLPLYREASANASFSMSWSPFVVESKIKDLRAVATDISTQLERFAESPSYLKAATGLATWIDTLIKILQKTKPTVDAAERSLLIRSAEESDSITGWPAIRGRTVSFLVELGEAAAAFQMLQALVPKDPSDVVMFEQHVLQLIAPVMRDSSFVAHFNRSQLERMIKAYREVDGVRERDAVMEGLQQELAARPLSA